MVFDIIVFRCCQPNCCHHCSQHFGPTLSAMGNHLVKKFGRKEDNLNPANDGEPREESHRASNETQLGLGLDLLVSLNVVKGCRVKVDPDKSKVWSNWNLNS